MIASLQVVIFFVFYIAIFGLSLWALIDLLRRPASAFPQAGKRTKGFWGAIVGVADGGLVQRRSRSPACRTFRRFLALLAAVGGDRVPGRREARGDAVLRADAAGPRGPSGPSGGW